MRPLQKCIQTYKTDRVTFFSYLFLIIHFCLNFLGLPTLKWFYLLEFTALVIATLFFPAKRLLIPVIGLFMIEGQGRILWEYHPLFRNCFDIILLIIMTKSIISSKRLFPADRVPKQILLLITLHFLWYTLQLFNINNVGFLGVIAAAKIYIFPFFVFFLCLKIEKINESLPKIQHFVLFAVLLEVSLIIFQVFGRDELMLSISHYYSVPMRDIFVGAAFRPFGTSFAPGAVAVILFLLLPLQMMVTLRSKKGLIISTIAITGSWVSLFFMQVRSATLKHIAIFVLFYFYLYVASSKKIHFVAKTALAVVLGILIFGNMARFQSLFSEVDTELSVQRFGSITYNIKDLKSKRIPFSMAVDEISKRLRRNPMGLGPGRTGSAASISITKIKQDPVYSLNESWAFDNLFVSLAIDLGIGMFLYLAIITLIPIILFFRLIRYFKRWPSDQRRIMALVSITSIVMLVGNWGAIAIPYNPESFIYWFLLAIGLNQHVPSS